MGFRLDLKTSAVQGQGTLYSGTTAQLATVIDVLTGSTTGLANKMVRQDITLGAGATASTDYTNLTGAGGEAVALDAVVALIFTAPSSNVGTVSMSPNATDGFTTGFGHADADVKLSPGGCLVFVWPEGLAVGASDKVLDHINNDGSNAAAISFVIVGREA